MSVEPATLADLARVASRYDASIVGDAATPIEDLEHDSRRVAPGTAFIALRGATSDGHEFARVAVDNGAAALVVDHLLDFDVPQLVVSNTRPLMAPLAAEVHRSPAEALTLVGVTGTNGKTTVTHMLAAIAAAAGRTSGLIGTLGARIGDRPFPLRHTTPEATEVQRLLRSMVASGVDLVAMEVSSHALAYGRADALRFDVAAFTNLSQDHLDFHEDMEDYYRTKRELFQPARTRHAVVFADDPTGARLANEIEVPTTRVGFAEDRDVAGHILTAGPTGTTIRVTHAHGAFETTTRLAGSFNAENALVAAACALAVGLPPSAITAGLEGMSPVPGRFESIDAGQPFTVIVDYAHTPDAIESVIAAMRPLTTGRLIAIGGAGGDRDRSKRPLMGSALASADIAILTSDNPRSEDPEEILAEVARGAVGVADRVVVEPDRRAAIRCAVAQAQADDVVLVLGKGHETGQDMGDAIHPFDDREVAIDELRRLVEREAT